jgi:hypothetical protein
MPNLTSDIAVIKSTLVNIQEDVREFMSKCDSYDKRFNVIEVEQGCMKTEHANMAKFQAVLSIILSAIAGYLGVALK